MPRIHLQPLLRPRMTQVIYFLSVQVHHSSSLLIWPLSKTRWHCLFVNYNVFAPYSKDIYKYKVLTDQLTPVLNFNLRCDGRSLDRNRGLTWIKRPI